MTTTPDTIARELTEDARRVLVNMPGQRAALPQGTPDRIAGELYRRGLLSISLLLNALGVLVREVVLEGRLDDLDRLATGYDPLADVNELQHEHRLAADGQGRPSIEWVQQRLERLEQWIKEHR